MAQSAFDKNYDAPKSNHNQGSFTLHDREYLFSCSSLAVNSLFFFNFRASEVSCMIQKKSFGLGSY